MPITRPLAVLATVAALVSIAPAAAQAATTPSDTVSASETARVWGPYYAPGKRAKTVGSLVAVGEDHGDLPTADTVKITGKLYDWTRDRSTCGWAVFRITYKANGNNLPHKHRSIRDCSYRTAKSVLVHPSRRLPGGAQGLRRGQGGQAVAQLPVRGHLEDALPVEVTLEGTLRAASLPSCTDAVDNPERT